MKVKIDHETLNDIFQESPLGIIIYNQQGNLVDANRTALKIMGIPELEDISGINLFESPIISPGKQKLLKEGLIKFQTRLDFDHIRNSYFYTSERSGEVLVDVVIKLIDSGFLVHVQEITLQEPTGKPYQSEDKYRRFFEDDLTGDFIATPDGNVMECNTSFAEIYGFNNSYEAVEANISQFNPEDWENLIKRIEAEHKVRGHQTTHQRPDGKQIHVVSNVVAIFNEFGNLDQVEGYIFDDTERKEAEDALRASEKKYRRLFDEDLTGDFIATPEGKILECNPAFADIYGFTSREDALDFNVSQFNSVDWTTLRGRLKKECKVQGYQSWQLRADGHKIHVVANVVGIFNDLKELIQVKGYVYDDTERKNAEEDLKKSEEKYHLLFDEDLTGDFIATPEGKILECNPAFASIYGFNNCETALQWNISQSNPFDWPYMITRLKNEGKILGFQSWQRRSDTLRIHVIANMVGMFNGSGELIQVKGYVFDDTERKHAEEELDRGKRKITGILNSIQDGFVALNNFWDFIYVNHCAAEYAGVQIDDLVGQNLWQRFPELSGTIHETFFRKAMNNNEIQHFEAPGIYKTDQWFDFKVYPLDEGISIYWRNITPRKKLQKK